MYANRADNSDSAKHANIDFKCAYPSRYRREKVQVIHESRNGGTTRITNLVAISRALTLRDDHERQASKTVAKRLIEAIRGKIGAIVKDSISETVIQANVSAREIESIICKFIEQNVLCPRCRMPEWTALSCNACGHRIGGKKKPARVTPVPEEDPIGDGPAPKQCAMMHRLYNLRDSKPKILEEATDSTTRASLAELLDEVDGAIDMLWRLSDNDDDAKSQTRLNECAAYFDHLTSILSDLP